MKQQNAKNVLINLISLLIQNLIELNDSSPNNGFVYGEKTAYVECLEAISDWKKAVKYGLNFDVEYRFPL